MTRDRDKGRGCEGRHGGWVEEEGQDQDESGWQMLGQEAAREQATEANRLATPRPAMA